MEFVFDTFLFQEDDLLRVGPASAEVLSPRSCGVLCAWALQQSMAHCKALRGSRRIRLWEAYNVPHQETKDQLLSVPTRPRD